MSNIFAKYDIVEPLIDKTKPYIDIKNKCIVCIVEKKKYYAVVQRYDIEDKCYKYFIIHTDVNQNGFKSIGTDLFGHTKFDIKNIWNNLNIISNKNFNISFDKVDADDTTNVYLIDF